MIFDLQSSSTLVIVIELINWRCCFQQLSNFNLGSGWMKSMDAELSIESVRIRCSADWYRLFARLHFPLLHARTDGWEALLRFIQKIEIEMESGFRFI
jgi:hypothetical protein